MGIPVCAGANSDADLSDIRSEQRRCTGVCPCGHFVGGVRQRGDASDECWEPTGHRADQCGLSLGSEGDRFGKLTSWVVRLSVAPVLKFLVSPDGSLGKSGVEFREVVVVALGGPMRAANVGHPHHEAGRGRLHLGSGSPQRCYCGDDIFERGQARTGPSSDEVLERNRYRGHRFGRLKSRSSITDGGGNLDLSGGI